MYGQWQTNSVLFYLNDFQVLLFYLLREFHGTEKNEVVVSYHICLHVGPCSKCVALTTRRYTRPQISIILYGAMSLNNSTCLFCVVLGNPLFLHVDVIPYMCLVLRVVFCVLLSCSRECFLPRSIIWECCRCGSLYLMHVFVLRHLFFVANF